MTTKALIEKYMQTTLSVSEIKSLSIKDVEFNNAIVRFEADNLRNGKIMRNTTATLQACEEFRAYRTGDVTVDLSKITLNPAGKDGVARLSAKQIAALFELLSCKEGERTLTMLLKAGVLNTDEILQNIEIPDIEKINDTVIKNEISSFYRNIEGCRILLSHAFLVGWVENGFSSTGYPESVMDLAVFINFKYSNLSHANLKGFDFREADLTGSCMDNADISKSNLEYAILKDVSMAGTLIDDLAGFCDADEEAITWLKEQGVLGLDYPESEYGDDDDDNCNREESSDLR